MKTKTGGQQMSLLHQYQLKLLKMSKKRRFLKESSSNKNRRRARGKMSIAVRRYNAVEKYRQFEKSLDELGGDYESTGMLLDKIEHHPELWNTNSDLYYDVQRRREAWISVCHSINIGFDMKSSEEKAKIGQVLMEKWKNIKDCYAKFFRREKYLGKGISLGDLSISAKNLSFLSLSQSISKGLSIFDDKVLLFHLDIKGMNEERISETPLSVTVGVIKTEQDDSSYHNSSEIFEAVDIEQNRPPCLPTISQPVGHEIPAAWQQFKTRTYSKAVPIEPALDSTESFASKTDSDMVFLKSLHPLIKDFNDDQKLKFQNDTLNIIKRIRQTMNQNINNSSQYSKKGISYSPIISRIYSLRQFFH